MTEKRYRFFRFGLSIRSSMQTSAIASCAAKRMQSAAKPAPEIVIVIGSMLIVITLHFIEFSSRGVVFAHVHRKVNNVFIRCLECEYLTGHNSCFGNTGMILQPFKDIFGFLLCFGAVVESVNALSPTFQIHGFYLR
uniref:Uncharacterized protein n=1 Tax=Podoviridae sp. cthau23 TaxID=2825268 RepID=A0A8S5U740_9CAUD|nr:MAG TPA: hypothetical protein [Podoviridae sp. cthau23]